MPDSAAEFRMRREEAVSSENMWGAGRAFPESRNYETTENGVRYFAAGASCDTCSVREKRDRARCEKRSEERAGEDDTK